jgi:hypothetical protein
MASQPHQPTTASQPGQPLAADEADRTRTVTGGGGAVPALSLPQEGSAGRDDGRAGNAGQAGQVVRYGPGVPSPGAAGQAGPTAGEVWRTGLPGAPRRAGRARRLAGPALSVALLAASAAVIYVRLHHGPFGVTGVAITAQVKHGCTEDVTGRVGTTGAAGTVSYQWVFQPQEAAPRPLSQPVASGQSAMYVTAAVEGQGHGSLTQTVTLQVLGPERGSASARVVLSC